MDVKNQTKLWLVVLVQLNMTLDSVKYTFITQCKKKKKSSEEYIIF